MKTTLASSTLPSTRLLYLGLTVAELAGSYLVGLGKLPLVESQRREQYLAELHQRNAMRLVERSGKMRGPFMKLIQLLSVQHALMPLEELYRKLPPDQVFFLRKFFGLTGLVQTLVRPLQNGSSKRSDADANAEMAVWRNHFLPILKKAEADFCN